MNAIAPVLNPNRQCGSCALCCHLGEIPGVKAFNQWCQHCSTQRGCDIYETRPQPCRSFFCHYRLSEIGEHWQPLACHMIVSTYRAPERMTITVDPDYPDAWNDELYLRDILQWAQHILITIMVGTHVYIVYPDGIEDLGALAEDETLLTVEQDTPVGTMRRVVKLLRTQADAQIAALTR